MKKTLLSLCIMLAAVAGQAFADDLTTNPVSGNKRFSVNVSTGEGGQIEIQGTGVVSQNTVVSATINTGEDVVLVITPDEGYKLATFYVDGANAISSVSNGTYTITAISKNISVSATFEVSGVKGDVNGDGTVNSADVVAIYNYITSGDTSGFTASDTDVNSDGIVNSADIVALYNIISGN